MNKYDKIVEIVLNLFIIIIFIAVVWNIIIIFRDTQNKLSEEQHNKTMFYLKHCRLTGYGYSYKFNGKTHQYPLVKKYICDDGLTYEELVRY